MAHRLSIVSVTNVPALNGAGKPRKTDYTDVPTAVFSQPPVGTCGVTELQAREKYGTDKVKPPTPYNLNLAPYTLHLAPFPSHPTPLKP